jgi:hypothetical protein
MTTTDNSLITFKAISNFTSCLNEVFGSNNRALKLYAHLISKTTLSHDVPIQKHVNVVREFCVANRESILSKNSAKINGEIKYSQRVYIDIKNIIKESDSDTEEIIWKHLLTLSALTDPAAKAKELLKETSKTSSANEADFLTDIIGKVEQHVDPNANPMEAVSSIMKSGIFTELVGGMGNGLQDGSLDLNKLMGTVQKMVGTLNEGMEGSGGGSGSGSGEVSDIMNTMMSSISAGSNGNIKSEDGVPDLSAVMGMVGPMLNALSQGGSGGGLEGLSNLSLGGGGGNSIEEKIDNQVAAAKKSGELPYSSSITEND